MASWAPLPILDRRHFINSGGVGEVFRDAQHPTRCIKRFFKPLIGEQAKQLSHLINVAAWARPSERHLLETRFSWPLIGFGSADRIEGFSMTYAPDESQFVLQIGGKQRKVLLQAKYLLDDRFWRTNRALTSSRPNVNEQDRLLIATEFLDAIEVLHRHDLVYGDVSGNNICIKVGEYPSVFFLDADSVVSPELRAQHLVRTPDWEISDTLDPVAADRSLTALFVWRLLTERPRARPSVAEARSLPGVAGSSCGLLLTELYETGSERAAEELTAALRESRSPERVAKAHSRAVRTGFARFVISEASASLNAGQREVVAKAERFVQLEAEVEKASGPRQRRLLTKIGTLDLPFVFDLSNVALMGAAPASVADLKRMLQDAEFAEVAQHLATSGLGNLENHWMVERALKHAYVQMGESAFAARAKSEHGVISWRWPSVRYINALRLEFLKDGQTILAEEIERDFLEATSERSLSVPGGGEVIAIFRFGTRSPTGQSFWVESASRMKLTVPPPPVVLKTVAAPQRATLVDTQSVALQKQLDDDLQRLAVLNQTRLRRRKLAVGLGSSVTVAAASLVALFFWPVADSRTQCQVPKLSNLVACALSQTGAIDASDRFGQP